MNIKKLKSKLIFSLVGFMILGIFSASHADGFVKYKKYLIPINANACESRPIPNSAPNAVDSGNARVFVTTDIGVRSDPDDTQSLAHILSFADQVEIEGFSTSSPGEPTNVRDGVSFIKKAINAYAVDLPRLKTRSPNGKFSDPQYLLSNVFQGINKVGNKNGGNWGKSAGSEAIIKAARCAYHKSDKRPLYILTWGSSTEVVRALEGAPDIAKYIRLVSYSHYNNAQTSYGNFIAVNDYLKRVSQSMKLWWIDYPVGSTELPLYRCTDSTTNRLQNAGKLGKTIKQNTDLSRSNASCSGGRGFKLGDTITTMFVFNSATRRNNPRISLWGRYSKSSIEPNIWHLRNETLRGINSYYGRSRVYSDWKSRVSNL